MSACLAIRFFRSGTIQRNVRAVLLAVFLLLAWGGMALIQAAPRELRLNITVGPPYVTEKGDGFIGLLLEELSRRVGATLVVNDYEGATGRALVRSNDGIDDGEVWRAMIVTKEYTNLRAVPEPVIRGNFSAFSVQHTFETKDWDSLKPYTVGHVIGWRIFSENVKGAREVYALRTPEQMFQMLALDRVDVVLHEEVLGFYIARQEGVKAHVLRPPLASIDMYMMLHKKNSDLLEPIAEAIRQMKKDLTYQRLVDRTLTPAQAGNG